MGLTKHEAVSATLSVQQWTALWLDASGRSIGRTAIETRIAPKADMLPLHINRAHKRQVVKVAYDLLSSDKGIPRVYGDGLDNIALTIDRDDLKLVQGFHVIKGR